MRTWVERHTLIKNGNVYDFTGRQSASKAHELSARSRAYLKREWFVATTVSISSPMTGNELGRLSSLRRILPSVANIVSFMTHSTPVSSFSRPFKVLL